MVNNFSFIRNLRFFINLLLLIKYVECWSWNKCYKNVELSIETINDKRIFYWRQFVWGIMSTYEILISQYFNISHVYLATDILLRTFFITSYLLVFSYYKIRIWIFVQTIIQHVKTGYKTGCNIIKSIWEYWNINTEMKHVCLYFLFQYLNFLSPPSTCQSVSILKWRCSVRVIFFSFDRCN